MAFTWHATRTITVGGSGSGTEQRRHCESRPREWVRKIAQNWWCLRQEFEAW